MRAARITGAREFAVVEAPIPTPGENQVLFRVEGSGVCASNLGPWFGLPWTQYPLAPGESGHEAWGVVESVGSSVKHVSPGDRISAVSYNGYAEFDVAEESSLLVLPAQLDRNPKPGEPPARAVKK
jgi:D-arabinose 1-dehydrogenase-like Zn-dependent alcohol dehydrogenase